MNRLIRLYPKRWRERYGVEFAALIEDARPGWRGTMDIAWNALRTRIATPSVREIGALAIAGLAVASVASWFIPDRYRSDAVGSLSTSGVGRQALLEALMLAETRVLSRTSLSKIIQEPDIDLYRQERRALPLEDVIQRMRERDVRISIASPPQSKNSIAFKVSMMSGTPDQAYRTTHRILNALIATLRDNAMGAAVLDPPSLPHRPASPNRWMIGILGMLAGLTAGMFWLGFARMLRA